MTTACLIAKRPRNTIQPQRVKYLRTAYTRGTEMSRRNTAMSALYIVGPSRENAPYSDVEGFCLPKSVAVVFNPLIICFLRSAEASGCSALGRRNGSPPPACSFRRSFAQRHIPDPTSNNALSRSWLLKPSRPAWLSGLGHRIPAPACPWQIHSPHKESLAQPSSSITSTVELPHASMMATSSEQSVKPGKAISSA